MKPRTLAQWSKAVRERDHYTCTRCGANDKRVIAHHIKPRDQYRKLALVLSNGHTLCTQCHSFEACQRKLFPIWPLSTLLTPTKIHPQDPILITFPEGSQTTAYCVSRRLRLAGTSVEMTVPRVILHRVATKANQTIGEFVATHRCAHLFPPKSPFDHYDALIRFTPII